MGLTTKYDEFYKTDLKKETLESVRLAGWPRNRVEAIVATGGTGNTVLDVGCGNGQLLYQFKDRYRNLVGLEFSQHRLRQAAVNLEGMNIRLVQGSAEQMGEIAANSIDLIVSADTIEHIPDVYAAMDEMFRVLKPGGRIVINTPNIAFIKKRALLLLGYFPSTSQPNEGLGSDVLFDGGHFHYFTYRSLRLLLERSGFQVTEKIGYGKLGRLHNWWPAMMSGGVQWVATKP